ncbi:MAG: aminoacyl-histidine dipeptidase [Cytophagaceae bacterium]|jgi:dipeptidase D|nr:aminoacyl-histidine dipeptidase [Cytophagaceae bacterium]
MSKELLSLEPKSLWENFYELTLIPRPSKKEEKAVKFAEAFGKKHGLETVVDKVGNVIIRKPATRGFENRMGVIMQSHLDMVPQKNSDTKHDFENDPITAYIDGEWVKAKGTTLGADNGIGAAATFAVLAANNLEHGPLEALFTIDEETGMTGANNLQPEILKGDILLNMDSEDEGELYVGCAGGSNANATFTFRDEPVPANHIAFELCLTGLKGGHSGMDICLGRGNANKIMFRFLKEAVAQCGARLVSIDGGSLRNAIPREAFAVIVLPADCEDDLHELLNEFNEIIRGELGRVEPDFSFICKTAQLPAFVMDEVTQDDLINAVQACPNGVIRMSTDMDNLVETSLNLAIVKSEGHEVKVMALIRSSVDTAKDEVESTLESLFRLAGAEISFSGQYPGWKPNMDSAILRTMQNVYKNKWGKVPEVRAIHAGLECGILGSVYPNWDMISFGPTIRSPHSPDERVNITSVEMFWQFLVETLKNIPVKR